MSHEGGKPVNVKVAVRCRPQNDRERDQRTPSVVRCDPALSEIHVNQHPSAKKRGKTYTFDNVFGQYAEQKEVYSTLVRPIVNEVLDGFNCTVFAYGQTGTGKTHTMTGDVKNKDGQGIIPRAIHEIFQYLESRNAEYSVKASYLELYNENLQDLFVPIEEKKQLRVVEDTKRGVTCQNLEEVLVSTPAEIYSLLETAMERRATAETLMNKNSSRSHSLFTVTIHIKETTPEGEDLMKTGKLNLVDLAGSECVGRSGAKDRRAREAGNINQSLLTLGRVITALVEHWPHVPYRDSKLTRLLQESLGGRAKTCIIATLSPSLAALEETLSTLDYAHRAKNIRNRPEVNQRTTKRALLKEFTEEIERLKTELHSAREKSGVYLPLEQYEAMQLQLQGSGAQVVELEGTLSLRQQELEEFRKKFHVTEAELEEAREEAAATQARLQETSEKLESTEGTLQTTRTELEETSVLLQAREQTETALSHTAQGVVQTLRGSASDVVGLHDKIGRKTGVETQNQQLVAQFGADVKQRAAAIGTAAVAFADGQRDRLEAFHRDVTQGASEAAAANAQAVDEARKAAASLREACDAIASACASARQATGDEAEAAAATLLQSLQAAASRAEAAASTVRERVSAVEASVTAGSERVRATMARATEQAAGVRQEACAFAEAQTEAANGLATVVADRSAAIGSALEETQRAAEEAQASEEAAARAEADQLKNQLCAMVDQFAAARGRALSQAVDRDTAAMATAATGVQDLASHVGGWAESRGEENADWRDRHVTQWNGVDQSFAAVGSTHEEASAAVTTRAHEVADAADEECSAVQAACTEAGATAANAVRGVASSAGERVDTVAGSARTAASEADKGGEATAAALEASSQRVQSLAGVSTEAADALGASVRSHAAEAQEQASGLSSAVGTFQEAYAEDVATGNTPARRDYAIPRGLPSTAPYPHILSAFRARRVQEEMEAAAADALKEGCKEVAVSGASEGEAVSADAGEEEEGEEQERESAEEPACEEAGEAPTDAADASDVHCEEEEEEEEEEEVEEKQAEEEEEAEQQQQQQEEEETSASSADAAASEGSGDTENCGEEEEEAPPAAQQQEEAAPKRPTRQARSKSRSGIPVPRARSRPSTRRATRSAKLSVAADEEEGATPLSPARGRIRRSRRKM